MSWKHFSINMLSVPVILEKVPQETIKSCVSHKNYSNKDSNRKQINLKKIKLL